MRSIKYLSNFVSLQIAQIEMYRVLGVPKDTNKFMINRVT